MNDDTPLRMADILLPLPADTSLAASATAPWMWMVGAALVSVLLLAWRFHRQPLRRLARDLGTGRLSPRLAAHRLAGQVGDGPWRAELDRLRFRREPPAAGAVAALIRRVARER